jgi:hypothetical protein
VGALSNGRILRRRIDLEVAEADPVAVRAQNVEGVLGTAFDGA